MKTKRLLSALALACLLPMLAWADVYQDPETKVNYEYTPGSGVASVKAGSDSEAGSPEVSGDIFILEKLSIDGVEYIVERIGQYAFSQCVNLTSVYLPESIESLGWWGTFNGCTNLQDINIPKKVTSLSYYIFFGCNNLSNIVLPEDLTYIGQGCFAYCSNLKSIIIPDGVSIIGDGAFEGCSSLTNVILPPNLTELRYEVFMHCTGLSSISIPQNISSIDEWAFRDCPKLVSITVDSENTVFDSRNNCNAIIKTSSNRMVKGCVNTIIPEGVKSIESYCFENCYGLTEIIIPNSVTAIKGAAFLGCEDLENITIPSSVKEIGNGAFWGCTSLSSVTLSEGVTSIGASAFAGCNITSVYIPASVTSIGNEAFSKTLRSIDVSEANTVYDSRSNCNAIIETSSNKLLQGFKNSTIPDGVIAIADNAFYGVKGLIGISIPNSVTTIGKKAFSGCTNLESLSIPNSITTIGDNAFSGLTNIISINSYLTSPPTITSNVFSGCYTATLYVPYGTAPLYKAATGWKSFTNIVEMEEEPDTPIYQDGDVFVAETAEGIELRYTVISAEDKTCMLGVTEPVGDEWEPSAYTDGNYYHSLIVDGYYSSFSLTLPEVVNGLTVVGIGEHALANSTLSGCNIPSTVTFIGDRAFYNTEISNFTVPASVTSIGWNVVSSINLQAITVEGGNEVYDSRNNCNAIIETATNTLLQGCNSTIIPDDIEAIAYWSLASADKMKELNIPKTVTSIGVMGVPNLEVITVDEENPVYDSRDNCNAIIETSTNTLVVGCKNTIIPETVIAIGDEAFENTSLESIFVPGSVKSIGNGAFYCFNLKEVTLAEGVEYIGESAFIGDGELETITIPSTVAYIGSDAFAYCSKGKTVTSYITTPFDVSGVFRFFGSSQEEPTTLYVPYGTKAEYEAAGGWDVFDNIVEMDCDLIVMEKAMQTYTSSYALDFSTPVEGLKAYTLTAVNDKGKAVLTEVTGAVPAGTGLVLMGTAGEQYAVPCVDGALESGDNLLVGVTADTEIGGNDTDYILKDGKFVKAIAGTLPAGKAYLKIDAASAREVIEIEGATTGIGNAVWAASSEGKVYNLNGQRVSQPMRGLYIVNGKKVIK